MERKGGEESGLIYAAAEKSKNTGEPVEVPNGTMGAASKFFDIYGTTEKKFETTKHPVACIGYVNIGGEEAIVVAIRHNAGLTVVTEKTHYVFSNDLPSLMRKREFTQQVIQAYKKS